MTYPERALFFVQYEKARRFVKPAIKLFGNGVTPTEARLKSITAIVIESYNRELESIPMSKRGEIGDQGGVMAVINREITLLLHYVEFLHTGQQIFSFSPLLVEMLSHSDIDKLTIDHLKLPYEVFYLALPNSQLTIGDQGFPINGVYVRELTASPNHKVITLTVVSNHPKGSWIIKPPFTYTVNLEFDERTQSIEAAIDNWLLSEAESFAKHQQLADEVTEDEEFQEEAAQAGIEFRVLDNDSPERQKRYRSIFQSVDHFRDFGKVVFNAIAYISYPKAEIATAFTPTPPARLLAKLEHAKNEKQKLKVKEQIKNEGYSRVYICGENLSKSLSRTLNGSKNKKATHWRRGHWWNKPIGPNHSLRELDWRMPMLVNKEQSKKPVKGHHYRVMGNATDPSTLDKPEI